MPASIGPGKYDGACTQARLATKAVGVVLLVIEGEKGTGFSVQGPMILNEALPKLLRNIADSIEALHKQEQKDAKDN